MGPPLGGGFLTADMALKAAYPPSCKLTPSDYEHPCYPKLGRGRCQQGEILRPFPSEANTLMCRPLSHIYIHIYYSYILKRKNFPKEKLLKTPSGSGRLLYPHPQKFSYKIFQCDLQETLPSCPPLPSPALCPHNPGLPLLQPSAIQSHLWPSMAAMAFCWVGPCDAPGGHVGCGQCR